MREEKIGEVMKFFAKPSVAAVKIVSGELNVGDEVKFTGFTTDYETRIDSMEIDNRKVEKAVAGDYIGIKVETVCGLAMKCSSSYLNRNFQQPYIEAMSPRSWLFYSLLLNGSYDNRNESGCANTSGSGIWISGFWAATDLNYRATT